MSWLGKLFGKEDAPRAASETVAPAAAADPFAGFENLHRDERRPRLEAFLGDLARSLDGGHVVAHPNEGTIDAQGGLGGFPVRVQAEEGNGLPELHMTLRLLQPVGPFVLVVDPTVDQTREQFDAWSDKVRIFFARSVFVLGDARLAGIAREQAHRFAALPEATRARVLALLVGISGIDVRSNEIRMFKSWRPCEADVRQSARAMLDVMVELARLMPAITSADATVAPTAAPLVRCSYCQAEFFLDSHAACSHCGAPFKSA